LSAGARSLGSLLAGLVAVPRDVSLTDVTLDSRQVLPGGAFLACRGERHHGLDFATDVARRGAAAIVWEPDGSHQPPRFESDIVLAEVPRLSERASLIANRFFDAPSRRLDVIGVTGTNGKTTCAWLLAQAFSACQMPAAFMGTLGTAFGGRLEAGEMTTPDAVTVQRELAGFVASGARKAAMEVSSHGLAQSRVADVRFDAAVFTNLTRDHLDFHGDMASYGAAKASLFEREDVRLRVFNVDDDFGARLAARHAFEGRIACMRRATAVPTGRFVQARDIRFDATGTRFALASSFGEAHVTTSLLGEFNVDNVLAVLAVLLGSGIALPRAVEVLRSLTPPSGRLEVLTRAGGPLVVVDYAHTPDALEKALQVLRRHCPGRLVAVFGCGGDRDRGKRPQMGAVAARLADAVVITDDNPRTESGDAIAAEILAGCAGSATPIRVQRDRRAAIADAIREARVGDVLLVAGKGHESVQIVGSEHRPFSDQAEVRAALGIAA
jgi:UDP-N-acetylmuramoyl-L-alanyl-D-glutamate--2,6-diaminopimelate ligase